MTFFIIQKLMKKWFDTS